MEAKTNKAKENSIQSGMSNFVVRIAIRNR